MITERYRQGVYIKDIAAELGVTPKTVSRALKRGSEPPKRPKRWPRKLDPFTGQIDEMFECRPGLAVDVPEDVERVETALRGDSA